MHTDATYDYDPEMPRLHRGWVSFHLPRPSGLPGLQVAVSEVFEVWATGLHEAMAKVKQSWTDAGSEVRGRQWTDADNVVSYTNVRLA